MNDLGLAFMEAARLIGGAQSDLYAIVALSLRVSLTAVAIAALIGLPLGALIAITRFRGRDAVIVTLNALMGLPPVVVGLVVYLLLSRAGPLGAFGLLFTPTAMVIAQTILITPIIAGLARQTLEDALAGIRRATALARRGPRSTRRSRCSGTRASRWSRSCWRVSGARPRKWAR